MTTPPAAAGDSVADIDTPALVVDLDAMDFNIGLMQTMVARAGRTLRAHAKAHKCAEIAALQRANGAIGLCCQKLAEAEALCAAGANDILITNEIVAPSKLDRLAALARSARVAVCVDSVAGVEALSVAAGRHGVVVRTFVEIDVGQGRCGVRPDESAVRLVRAILQTPNLVFAGLQAYHGKAQHFRTGNERQRASASVASQIRQVIELLYAANIECPIVTGGGTGTVATDLQLEGLTEIQAGSYIFMDADYARNVDMGTVGESFRQSLYVKASVVSIPTPDRVVIDAGLKAVSIDSGMPLLRDTPDIDYARGGDEHGILNAPGIGARYALGEAVWLVPSHCDTTLNLFDWIVGIRTNRVESVWKILARGAIT